MGLVTISPIGEHDQIERVTFLLEEKQGTQVREKVVTGWLQTFGKGKIQYQGRIYTAQRKAKPASTQVLALYSRKKAITEEEWRMIQKMTTASAIRKQIIASGKDLPLEDAFKIEQNGGHFSCLIRVPRDSAIKWMLAKVPFTASPLGSDADSYKVLWDREGCTPEELREKFKGLPGYTGPVLTQRGGGARVLKANINAAKEMSGQIQGDAYIFRGVPTDLLEEELEELLKETGWEATILAHTRRVRFRKAQYTVKACKEPPETVLRIQSDQEITTLQISPYEARKPQPKQEQPAQEPNNWLQAAQRALGKSRDMDKTGEVPGRKHPREPEHDETAKCSRLNVETVKGTDPDDSMDDAYVEEAPRPKPSSPEQREGPRAKAGRLAVLEKEMGEMRQNVAEILNALHQLRSRSAEPRAMKGVLPWPPNVSLNEGQVISVPGDGNCLWHSCYVWTANHSREPQQVAPGGSALKQRVLQELHNNAEHHARLWGAAPDGVQAAAREWITEWADARALLSISEIMGVNILVTSEVDGVFELITAKGKIQEVCGSCGTGRTTLMPSGRKTQRSYNRSSMPWTLSYGWLGNERCWVEPGLIQIENDRGSWCFGLLSSGRRELSTCDAWIPLREPTGRPMLWLNMRSKRRRRGSIC